MSSKLPYLFWFVLGVAWVLGEDGQTTKLAPIPVSVQAFAWSVERDVFSQSPLFSAENALDDPGMQALFRQSTSESTSQNRRRDRRQPDFSMTTEPAAVGTDSPREQYQYTVKLKNTDERPIRAVVWDYVFTDPDSGRELGRLRFRTEKTIKPGKTRRLEVYTRRPPTGSTSVSALRPRGESRPGEAVQIVRIVFADNSVWRAR